jgi:RNA polymerase sigma-70 factor, ECF subfamily
VNTQTPVIDPDADLVQLASKGDPNAITELYRRYEHRAYNLALRMLNDPWDAADVTQEAFIKAFGALPRFRGEARFGTWLHRIVANAVHDHLRRRRADPLEDEVMERVSSGSPGAGGVPVGGVQAAVGPAADGLSEPLRAALLDLDEGFRLAVVLCDLLGYNYADAAEILGVQEGTIKSRIFRARAALSVRLRDAGYEPEQGNPPLEPPVTAGANSPGPRDE